MRRVSATYVYPVSSPAVDYGIILLDQGVIHELDTMGNRPKESSSLEYYNGILTPGFINLNSQPDLFEDDFFPQNRIFYEKGIRAITSFLPSESGIMKLCEFSVREILDKTNLCSPYRLKTSTPAIADASLLNPNELGSLQNIEWIILSQETIRMIDQNFLKAFFMKYTDKILFSWHPDHPLELCSIFNYFLKEVPDITFQDILRPVTINPAKLIGQKGLLGELKPRISPGINLLSGIDFRNMLFREKDFGIKRIV